MRDNCHAANKDVSDERFLQSRSNFRNVLFPDYWQHFNQQEYISNYSSLSLKFQPYPISLPPPNGARARPLRAKWPWTFWNLPRDAR